MSDIIQDKMAEWQGRFDRLNVQQQTKEKSFAESVMAKTDAAAINEVVAIGKDVDALFRQVGYPQEGELGQMQAYFLYEVLRLCRAAATGAEQAGLADKLPAAAVREMAALLTSLAKHITKHGSKSEIYQNGQESLAAVCRVFVAQGVDGQAQELAKMMKSKSVAQFVDGAVAKARGEAAPVAAKREKAKAAGEAATKPARRASASALLENIRYAPEKEKLAGAMAQFDIEKHLQQFEQSGEMSAFRQHILGTQMRLSATLSPRLFGLLEEVKKAIEFDAPVELFVAAEPTVNAFAVHSLDDTPHVVSLTSSLVEKMNDAELRFVIGHELGHLAYQHYRAKLAYPAIGMNEKGESKMPRLLQRKLDGCARLAELSADRAGYVAISGDLKAVVSAFFKMVCGLGPEHVHFDIAAFLGQLEEMQKAGQGNTFCGFSHPLTPIRVRALQLFAETGGAKATAAVLKKLDAEVSELARLMDYQVTAKLDQNGRDLILAGGLLVSNADQQDVSQDEYNLLVDMLLPLMEDPQEEMAKIDTVSKAEALLAQSTKWIRENAGKEKFQMFSMLSNIAAVDGALKGSEEAVLLRIAEALGIPASAARETILNAVSYNLQMQQGARMPVQRLA